MPPPDCRGGRTSGRQAALRGSATCPSPASPGSVCTYTAGTRHGCSGRSSVCLQPGRCLKTEHEALLTAEEGELQRQMESHREQGYLQEPGGASGSQDGAEDERETGSSCAAKQNTKRGEKGPAPDKRAGVYTTHTPHIHTPHTHTARRGGLFAFTPTDAANPNALTHAHVHTRQAQSVVCWGHPQSRCRVKVPLRGFPLCILHMLSLSRL